MDTSNFLRGIGLKADYGPIPGLYARALLPERIST